MGPHNPSAQDIKAKLAEVGYSSDYKKDYGYFIITIWKKADPERASKAAGLTPLSAYFAAAIELIRKHV